MQGQPFHHLEQCMLLQKVVMIQKRHILPGSQGQGRIGIARDPQILRKLLIADPLIPLHIAGDDLFCRVVLSAAVGDAQLQPGIGLGQDRLDHLPQKPFRRPVYRHYHTDTGRKSKKVRSLQLLLTLRRTASLHPVLISFFQAAPVQMLLYLPAQPRHPVAFHIMISALCVTDIFHSDPISLFAVRM